MYFRYIHEISKTQAAIRSTLLQLWLNMEHIPDEECAASKEFYRSNRSVQSPTVLLKMLLKMLNSTIIVINVNKNIEKLTSMLSSIDFYRNNFNLNKNLFIKNFIKNH